MEQTVIYVHGQGGSAAEAEHYRPLFPHTRVAGLAYGARTPWEAAAEFPALFRAACTGSGAVTLIANSIGAYFAMTALPQQEIAEAFFISPVVDMAKLIGRMMAQANVSEAALRESGEIGTASGTLSWEYLVYAREHPPRWTVPTRILYGGRDALIPRTEIDAFARQSGAALTVMDDGEHWFHTAEQMRFLDRWITAAH